MKQQQQQQTVVTSAGPIQPVHFDQPYQTISVISSYHHRQSTLIGALMVLAGILSIIFSTVMIAVAVVAKDSSYYAAVGMANSGGGIVCGIMIIITGGFGIAAGRLKSKCKIITFLVLAVVAALFVGSQAFRASFSAYAVHVVNDDNAAFVKHGHVDNNAFHGTTVLLMLIMLAILGVIEFALCLWGSILCCAGSCCGSQPAVYTMIPAEETNAMAQRPVHQEKVVYPKPPEYPGYDPK